MTLYFLKGSSGYIKIGRTNNFDKRLSEIRRATTDSEVSVLAVFHGADDFIIERERELHFNLTKHRFKGEWYFDAEPVRQAIVDCDREFHSELVSF
jgi:Meiotically up-regulated gene 113